MNRSVRLETKLSSIFNVGVRLFALTLFIVNLASAVSGAEPEHASFSIVSAGVEDAEDAPFVSSNYRFLPGEYVYVSFQVSGFTVKGNEEQQTRAISLHYEVTPIDVQGRALTQSAHMGLSTAGT